MQSDVDFEQNHDNEQNRAERDLRPFVKLVTMAELHLVDAPGEHEHDANHCEAHHVDHQRRARLQETIDARKTGRIHREDNKLVPGEGQGLKSVGLRLFATMP